MEKKYKFQLELTKNQILGLSAGLTLGSKMMIEGLKAGNITITKEQCKNVLIALEECSYELHRHKLCVDPNCKI